MMEGVTNPARGEGTAAQKSPLRAALPCTEAFDRYAWLASFLFLRGCYWFRVIVGPTFGWQ